MASIPSDTPAEAGKGRKTPLYSRHLALGATMADYGEWRMPLWYRAGAVREHLAVISAAGLFDTSHMDVLLLEGAGAVEFLNRAATKDISGLKTGRTAYGAFLDDNGFVLDDATFYLVGEGRVAVVVNAGKGGVIRRHLAAQPFMPAELEIRQTPGWPAKLDIQGRAAARILGRLLANPADIFASFPYFSFKGDFDFSRSAVSLADGTPLVVSRSGYTGESGFELYLPPERAGDVWDGLMDAGSGEGLLPCGLAARDSLRAGAVLPLSGHDMGGWPFLRHPWRFALPIGRDGRFTKEFIGRRALELATDAPYVVPFVGFDPRRVETDSAAVLLGDAEIGVVTTIVTDVALGRVDGRVMSIASPGTPPGWTPRGLACGFVKIDRSLDPGTRLVLRDARRGIEVETCGDIRPDRGARRPLAF